MRKSSVPESGAVLAALLQRLEGRPYAAYKDLRGSSYELPGEGGVLTFESVQGDPFAAPSQLCIRFAAGDLLLPEFAFASRDARRASADFLQRALRRSQPSGASLGSGKSGVLEIAPLGPEVLERTAVSLSEAGGVTVRVVAGLPARGRRILGREAHVLLLTRLPEWLASLVRIEPSELERHVHSIRDQVVLREQLADAGLVAFLAEGSVLPRRTGVHSAPLADARPLEVPTARRVTLTTPHSGKLVGLGIPRGVTLIVGGGYHGKTTLLSAIALGVYDHVPGDGRERCVTLGDAMSIRAEDGRSVSGCDLRPFIGELPMGRDTASFETQDASGSTSQAAAIVEAIEVGARVLLVDEDTAATNFMIRDARMRRLVPASQEPITPYLDRVQQLYEQRGVSSVLVVGGAGDYLDVADCVIQMDTYQPRDVTARAREIARELPLGEAAPQIPGTWETVHARIPDPRSFDPSKGRRSERVRSVRTRSIEFGREEVDVSALIQLVDPAQCRFIGDVLLEFARGLCDGRRSLMELLDKVERSIEDRGLEAIAEPGFGDRALARRFEIAAALNRLRSLRVRPA